jgi:hypothetical protein
VTCEEGGSVTSEEGSVTSEARSFEDSKKVSLATIM